MMEAVDAVRAVPVEPLQVRVVEEDLFVTARRVKDAAVGTDNEAQSVHPWRGVVHHDEADLVLEGAHADESAVDLLGGTATGERIEEEIDALEHQQSRRLRHLAVVADHHADPHRHTAKDKIPRRKAVAASVADRLLVAIDVDFAKAAE